MPTSLKLVLHPPVEPERLSALRGIAPELEVIAPWRQERGLRTSFNLSTGAD